MTTTKHWIGEKYHENSGQQKFVADSLISQYSFRGNEVILDVGCGDGKITFDLLKYAPQGRVVGIDPSESMISFARNKYESSRSHFEMGMASELKFFNEFDLVTSFSSLHWEPRQKEALASFRKALKPNGKILLAIPGPNLILRNALKKTCEQKEWVSFFEHYHSPGRIWTPNEYALLIIETQLNIQKIEWIDRIYRVGKIEAYQGLIESMLPHLSQLPSSLCGHFIEELLKVIQQEGHRDEDGNLLFAVKVLEVIAYA